MITFLIDNDHQVTARCLDYVRLNRQLTECVQIAKLLYSYDLIRKAFSTRRVPFGIIFPPVVKLWIAPNDKDVLLNELFQYYYVLHEEWKRLSGKEHNSFCSFDWARFTNNNRTSVLVWPIEVIHSHRSKLMLKDPTHYGQVFARERILVEKTLSYVWQAPEIIGAK